ncbi:sensor domain-containing diguanylate cyclase [Thermobrachium celere]|uniref:Diguanylate cyclase (GGDEF domain) n=1 Tax=Thermobrachium celere DSM 8682 TaxID=941824 RepID=R7RP91_9CLOT|nr:sensor domain-containing diguanylate cyclase [Thermobrachium celere]CDF57191.1 diguanylate cyclase (GGDEF domain) [Thermobrachium celere DSM 8682]
MFKRLKVVITVFLLIMSIVPLILFSSTFFFSVINYFTKNDEKNILEILTRNKKYLEVFVEMNIDDMRLLANSDDLKSYEIDEIKGVLERFLSTRDEYSKIKYIDKDGWFVEVDRSRSVYEKYLQLSQKERLLFEKGDFSTIISEDGINYVVFSSPYEDENRHGIVVGYIDLNRFDYIFKDLTLTGLGNIIIKDSSGNYLFKMDNNKKYDEDVKEEIKNTDFSMIVSINREDIRNVFLNDLFRKLTLYFFLTVVMAIVFAYIISEAINKYITRIIVSINTLTRIKSTDSLLDNIKEIETFKNKFNEIIEKLNKDKIDLSDKAYIDALTGLYNKRFLSEKLSEKLKEVNENVYFMMADIDYFKKINDTYGHIVGDRVLKSLAEILKQNIREGDYAIRFGGEEFLIVFRNITKKEALNIAERLRVQVEKFVYREEKLNIKFTISIGVAKFKNGIEYTIDISDEALYSAKSLGRNRVVYKEV